MQLIDIGARLTLHVHAHTDARSIRRRRRFGRVLVTTQTDAQSTRRRRRFNVGGVLVLNTPESGPPRGRSVIANKCQTRDLSTEEEEIQLRSSASSQHPPCHIWRRVVCRAKRQTKRAEGGLENLALIGNDAGCRCRRIDGKRQRLCKRRSAVQ